MATSMETEQLEANQEYDPKLRNDEITKIVFLTDFLHKKYYGEDLKKEPTKVDIDVSNAISGIFHTLFVYMRKLNNTNIQNRGTLNGDKQASIGNKNFSIGALYTELKEKEGYECFDFKIATPIVDALCSFRCMWDEVRLSCNTFKLRIKGELKTCQLKDFGLDNAAIPRMRGITWKPERRSGMMKTMGPLTLAILLSAETKYTDKISSALENSISILPMAKQIVKCLKELKTPMDANGLFSVLNLILMLIGNRSAHKIHFPLLFICKAYNMDKVNTLKLNFSGLKGFLFYASAAPKFSWFKRSSSTPEKTAQVVFHSIFGTNMEDLGVLSQITNCRSWVKRNSLLDVFKNNSEALSTMFSPVMFTYISKMACANIVKNSGTITPQLDCDYVFAGNRKRSFSEAFMGFVERGHRGTAYSEEITALTYAMKNFKDSLVADARSGKLQDLGTTKWYKIVGDDIEESELVVTNSDTFFYS